MSSSSSPLVESIITPVITTAQAIYETLFDDHTPWEVLHYGLTKLGIPRWLSWVLLGSATCSIGYYFMVARQLAKVYVKDKSDAARIVSAMKNVLGLPYSPTPWAINTHINTILGSRLRYNPDIPIRREEFKLGDGGVVGLDWFVTDLPEDAPILFVMPGLTGSSESSYIRQFGQLVWQELGFQVVVMVYRGLLGLPLITPQGYSGGWTNDMRDSINHVKKMRPKSLIYTVGYSLGSNIMVKYLGEEGSNAVVSAAISVGNPYDFVASSKTLANQPLYTRALSGDLVRYYKTHMDIFSKHPVLAKQLPDILKVKTLRQFDSLVTSVVFNFDSADSYYYDASSSRYLSKVAIPLLCVSAVDDPIVDPESIPIHIPEQNPNVTVVVTARGGHLGFLEGWWPTGPNWCDRVGTEFFKAHQQQLVEPQAS